MPLNEELQNANLILLFTASPIAETEGAVCKGRVVSTILLSQKLEPCPPVTDISFIHQSIQHSENRSLFKTQSKARGGHESE